MLLASSELFPVGVEALSRTPAVLGFVFGLISYMIVYFLMPTFGRWSRKETILLSALSLTPALIGFVIMGGGMYKASQVKGHYVAQVQELFQTTYDAKWDGKNVTSEQRTTVETLMGENVKPFELTFNKESRLCGVDVQTNRTYTLQCIDTGSSVKNISKVNKTNQ